MVVFMSGLCFRGGYQWNISKIEEVVKPKKLALKGGSKGEADSEKILKARKGWRVGFRLNCVLRLLVSVVKSTDRA